MSQHTSWRRYRIAICGLGRAGQIHLKNCFENPLITVKYLVVRSTGVAEQLVEYYGLSDVKIVLEQDFRQVLNDPGVDGVIISSSTPSHESYVMQCIEARKPMFCEKPVAQTFQQTLACLEAAERHRVPLFVAFNRRFDSSHAAVKNCVSNGDVGRIQSVVVISRDSPRPQYEFLSSSAGMFHDMVIHDIDMGMWIIGEYPTTVFACGHAFEAKLKEFNDVDTVSVVMQFPSGAMLQINATRYASYGYDQRVEVFGDKGMVRSDNQPSTSLHRASSDGQFSDVLKFSFPQRYAQAFSSELNHFVEILSGSACDVKKEDVIMSSLVASACEESMRIGKVVKVNEKTLTFSS